jgi:GGDEF domain-containing protein
MADKNHLRATSIVARTLYRELRRANYSQAHILDLVNELLGIVIRDTAIAKADSKLNTTLTVDNETGLPDAQSITEVLGFELRHAQKNGSTLDLTIACLRLNADAIPTKVHRRLAYELSTKLRAIDSVGRLEDSTYLIVLPRAPASSTPAILNRLKESLNTVLEGFTADIRWASRSATTTTATQLIEACKSAPAQPVCAKRDRNAA